MAELVLSGIIPVLFEKLVSEALENIARNKGIEAEIEKLKESLNQIQSVLTDVAEKEITSQPVKRWLNELQHLAYDIDDFLDGLATEAMDCEFNRLSKTITSKVRKLIPTFCTNFLPPRKHEELDNITTKLQNLLKEKSDLGLTVKEEPD
ncbi:hypothetical protein L1987_38459 [Smallanthus sonchifolius]|uniref:Uncharacterized protein n=1 Tax=Smallanthus sonchifolius TaxID=185202 RepID=A0ACB9HL26_9ASTR|nr:hypothetical protein L1987_38459 [Smallanthus sonchifolius]